MQKHVAVLERAELVSKPRCPWSDPRQLERRWEPPSYPATFVDHDLTPGGRAAYFMTSPEGPKFHGWWRIERAEPPNRLRLRHDDVDRVEQGMVEALGQIDALLPGERA